MNYEALLHKRSQVYHQKYTNAVIYEHQHKSFESIKEYLRPQVALEHQIMRYLNQTPAIIHHKLQKQHATLMEIKKQFHAQTQRHWQLHNYLVKAPSRSLAADRQTSASVFTTFVPQEFVFAEAKKTQKKSHFKKLKKAYEKALGSQLHDAYRRNYQDFLKLVRKYEKITCTRDSRTSLVTPEELAWRRRTIANIRERRQGTFRTSALSTYNEIKFIFQGHEKQDDSWYAALSNVMGKQPVKIPQKTFKGGCLGIIIDLESGNYKFLDEWSHGDCKKFTHYMEMWDFDTICKYLEEYEPNPSTDTHVDKLFPICLTKALDHNGGTYVELTQHGTRWVVDTGTSGLGFRHMTTEQALTRFADKIANTLFSAEVKHNIFDQVDGFREDTYQENLEPALVMQAAEQSQTTANANAAITVLFATMEKLYKYDKKATFQLTSIGVEQNQTNNNNLASLVAFLNGLTAMERAAICKLIESTSATKVAIFVHQLRELKPFDPQKFSKFKMKIQKYRTEYKRDKSNINVPHVFSDSINSLTSPSTPLAPHTKVVVCASRQEGVVQRYNNDTHRYTVTLHDDTEVDVASNSIVEQTTGFDKKIALKRLVGNDATVTPLENVRPGLLQSIAAGSMNAAAAFAPAEQCFMNDTDFQQRKSIEEVNKKSMMKPKKIPDNDSIPLENLFTHWRTGGNTYKVHNVVKAIFDGLGFCTLGQTNNVDSNTMYVLTSNEETLFVTENYPQQLLTALTKLKTNRKDLKWSNCDLCKDDVPPKFSVGGNELELTPDDVMDVLNQVLEGRTLRLEIDNSNISNTEFGSMVEMFLDGDAPDDRAKRSLVFQCLIYCKISLIVLSTAALTLKLYYIKLIAEQAHPDTAANNGLNINHVWEEFGMQLVTLATKAIECLALLSHTLYKTDIPLRGGMNYLFDFLISKFNDKSKSLQATVTEDRVANTFVGFINALEIYDQSVMIGATFSFIGQLVAGEPTGLGTAFVFGSVTLTVIAKQLVFYVLKPQLKKRFTNKDSTGTWLNNRAEIFIGLLKKLNVIGRLRNAFVGKWTSFKVIGVGFVTAFAISNWRENDSLHCPPNMWSVWLRVADGLVKIWDQRDKNTKNSKWHTLARLTVKVFLHVETACLYKKTWDRYKHSEQKWKQANFDTIKEWERLKSRKPTDETKKKIKEYEVRAQKIDMEGKKEKASNTVWAVKNQTNVDIAGITEELEDIRKELEDLDKASVKKIKRNE